jgi:hypothetical protein
MAILILFLAASSCAFFISGLCKPILQWNPEGWPKWLVITLKVIGIVAGSVLLIAGAVAFAICAGAFGVSPKK